MTLLLPTDANGNPIAVLGYRHRGTQRVTVTINSARNVDPIPPNVELVTIIAQGPCRFEVGDASVTADMDKSAFLYPGQYLDIPLRPSERHVAFIAEADPCDAYIIARL
jgi:hypothetical protein